MGSGGERQDGARSQGGLAPRPPESRKYPTGFPGSCYPGQSNETAGTLCPGFFLGGVHKFQQGMTNFVIWRGNDALL